MPEQPIYDEQDLLRQVAAGNQDAFARIFELYRQRLYSYLAGITKSPEVAEDILVDVFMKLWIGREILPRIENLEGFLYKVAYNKAMDFFKTTARHARLQQVYAQRIGQPEQNPEDWFIDEETRRILHEAVNQLPPQRKLIYTLSREQGLTYEEIAKALHLSRNTVKATIMAATRSISEYLQKKYPGNAALSVLFFLT